METNQKPIDQNPTKTELQLPKEGSSSRLFLVVILSVLLTGVVTGSIVYFWQKSSSEEAVNNLEQKIASLEKQISTMRGSTVSTPQQISPPQSSPAPITEITADWKTYIDATYGFSIKYPPSWRVSKGNEHVPSIPSSMTKIIKLQSRVGTTDVSIIPWHNDLKKDLREELSSFISRYFGDWDVSYEGAQVGKEPALRGSYVQSAEGSQTKVVFIAVEKGDRVFFFLTQFNLEDSSRFDMYSQILSTSKFED